MKDQAKIQIEEFQAKYETELHIIFNEIKKIDAIAEVVLKSHLLIEDLLNKILKKQLVTSDYLDELKLEFYQKVFLCRSLRNRHNHFVRQWSLIILLNKLRNEVAHNLNSVNRKKRLEAIKTVIHEFAQDSSFSCKGFNDKAYVEAAFFLSHQFLSYLDTDLDTDPSVKAKEA